MPVSYATVEPGVISPRRAVPGAIAAPEYVDRPAPRAHSGPEGKDAETIVASAKKLGAAKDIADARTAFGEVSDAIEDLSDDQEDRR